MANRRSAGAVQDNVKGHSPEVRRGRDDAPGCPEDEGLLYADVEAGAEGDDALGLPSAAEYGAKEVGGHGGRIAGAAMVRASVASASGGRNQASLLGRPAPLGSRSN
jgi:hypothetical protein